MAREMISALPFRVHVCPNEADERFVHQGRGLQRLAPLFPGRGRLQLDGRSSS